MKLTRRGRAAAGCGLALVAGAILLAAPALLVAAGLLFAWLLGAQVAFVAALRRERDALSASVDAPLGYPAVDEASVLRLEAAGDGLLPLRVTLDVPAAARRTDSEALARSAGRGLEDSPDDRDTEDTPTGGGPEADSLALTLDARDREAGRSADDSIVLEWPIAGRFRVGAARATATDRLGLFAAAFETDAVEEVVVRPHEPETTHLGLGDERVVAFGEHTAGRRGPGTEPAELRPYAQGDDLGRIDWNATARLQEAYVAESEAETDRRTVLFVDHRATSDAGPPGGTALDYLRYAGLAVVESARQLGDPLGCYAVGDGGVTLEHPPRTNPGQYDAVAESLRGLAPTSTTGPSQAGSATVAVPAPHPTNPDAGTLTGGGDEGGTTMRGGTATRGGTTTLGGATAAVPPTSGDPAVAATKAGRLAGDDAPFARRLRPLLSDATPYLHRVDDEPLFSAVRTYLGRLQGTVWSVILTDGEHPAELRETVKLARRGRNRVLVVLAPAALFRDESLPEERDRTETEVAAFVRSLAAMEGVAVRQIGPGDAVERIIGAGGERG